VILYQRLIVAWFMTHPMEALAAMVALAVLILLVSIAPSLHQLLGRNYPPC
jgi:hypothetical protein